MPNPIGPRSNPINAIGTPLSPSATRVMLLGAGELGKEVIIALQRLGVETIAVDRYPDAPGMQVAHRSHVMAMTDGAALRALVEAGKPQLIVPEIEAIATDMLLEIEREGLAEVIPTARATNLTMNREGIRRLVAEELGLPTSPYAFCDSLAGLQAAIDAGIGYPCLVKPTMSSSGKGQSLLRGPDDVAKAWDYAMQGGRVSQGRVIVEGFIDFEYEITLLTVRAVGASGEIETHFCEPVGHVQVSGDYVESWQPQAMSPVALEKSRAIAKAVTESLGGRGLFGVELFVAAIRCGSPKSARVRTTPASSRWPRNASPSSNCTRAPSSVCRSMFPARAGRLGRHLRRRRRQGHRLRRRRRRAARAGHRPAPVRQAGELQEAPHGRRRRHRCDTDEARSRAKLAAGKVRPVWSNKPKND
jgi:phosphoribosylglycinamide formyltransferase 2